MLVAGVLSLIFISLSIIHWYWVFGGQVGLDIALPSTGKKQAFSPGPFATALVALLLMFAAWLCLAQAEIFGLQSSALTRFCVGGLAVVFAMRAIGDFRFVGIFKRIKGTPFSRMDTLLFTPLCLLISILCWWLLKRPI